MIKLFNYLKNFLYKLIARIIAGFVLLLTGARAIHDAAPTSKQKIYFANHNSHIDFILLWACLSPNQQALTRPVAGSDYWLKNSIRSFFGNKIFRAVLINRDKATRDNNPLEQMTDALKNKNSLIIFPEGTRNTTGEILLEFKSGIYHLGKFINDNNLDIELIPVWISNLNRVMPKGELIPVPLLCTVHFGAALKFNHDKKLFLSQAREEMLKLRNIHD